MPVFNNPSWDIEFGAAFSAKQQTTFATALGDSDLDKVFTLDQIFNPQRSRLFRSDRRKFGKGHGFATPGGHVTFGKDAPMGLSGELNSFLAGWLASFGLGKVTTTQPDAGGNPTVYRHTSVPFDPLVTGSKQPPVTTVYVQEGSAAGFKNKLMGMAVSDWSISGEATDVLKWACNLVGRGELSADPVALGAATPGTYLDNGGCVITFGPQGAGTDYSDRVLRWSVGGNNDLDEKNGRYPGSGLYRGRIWVGSNRRYNASLDVFLKSDDADILTAWGADTLWELKFVITGAVISSTYYHKLTIFFPSIRLGDVPIKVEDGKMVHQISIGEDLVYKDSGAGVTEPIQIIVDNTQATYLVAA